MTRDSYLGNAMNPLILNRYAYTNNNPVMNIDPSGKSLTDYINNKISYVGDKINQATDYVGSYFSDQESESDNSSSIPEKISESTGSANTGCSSNSQAGWQKLDGSWYYLSEASGEMKTNELILSSDRNNQYYVGSDGMMLESTSIKYNGTRYILRSDGTAIMSDDGEVIEGNFGKYLWDRWPGQLAKINEQFAIADGMDPELAKMYGDFSSGIAFENFAAITVNGVRAYQSLKTGQIISESDYIAASGFGSTANGTAEAGDLAASVKWKGFSKGELSQHFDKHGSEFGGITQNQYLNLAKDFAMESNSAFKETKVGNFMIKYDPETRRVLVGQAKSREIRTFYKADGRDEDPFEAAINLAKELSGIIV